MIPPVSCSWDWNCELQLGLELSQEAPIGDKAQRGDRFGPGLPLSPNGTPVPEDVAVADFADSDCKKCGGTGAIIHDDESRTVCPCAFPLMRKQLERSLENVSDEEVEAALDDALQDPEPVDLQQLADPGCSLCIGTGYTVEGTGDKPTRCPCTDDKEWPADPDCNHCSGKGFVEVHGQGLLECLCTMPGYEKPSIEEEKPEEPKADPLYQQAVVAVIHHQKASGAFLQKELGIGADRAKSILEDLEKAGVVSAVGSGKGKGRAVLMGSPEPDEELDTPDEADLDEADDSAMESELYSEHEEYTEEPED